MKIWDISPTINESIAVFPGDINFLRSESHCMKNGDAFGLSSIKTTVHLGAHTDAPIHYHPDGEGMESRDLNYYLGKCQVIEVNLSLGQRVMPEHLIEIKAPRVLFKTLSFPNFYEWNKDFCALSPQLIDVLAKKQVCLVGIDTPSIDLADDKELKTHTKVYENNMAILEGIDLSAVPEGLYKLIALPLKLEGADASPVRAVLVEGEWS